MNTYERQTIKNPNLFARYAHKNRLNKVLKIILDDGNIHRLLDYGCGSGLFIASLREKCDIEAVGYEPYMNERVATDLPIYKDLVELDDCLPFDVVSIFETIEHLDESELKVFLSSAKSFLKKDGRILFSAPIEIGPALLLKEFNRCALHKRKPEMGVVEFLNASIMGVPARRAENIKTSHRGFDFRRAIDLLINQSWSIEIIEYGPLPLNTWYGNSQVYFWAKRIFD